MSAQFQKSFKTKLRPTKKQRMLFAQSAGVARHAWNWGLDQVLKALGNKEKVPSSIDLHKRLVAEVKKENPWYYDVSKCPPHQALRNLETACKRWFKKISKKPRFKKRNRKDSFYLEGSIQIDGNKIKLPRIGWVKCFESLPGSTNNIIVSKQAGEWYVSYTFNHTPEELPKRDSIIGVDLGVKTLAQCSDGTIFENPKAYKKNLKKLKMIQKRVSRKQKGSKNREKLVVKLQRAHKKISDIRTDMLHKLTTWLAKNHGAIGIEQLNTSGMLRNHRLAQSIADCGFGTFRSFLSYKCQWYGTKLVVADQFYPSSKLCSECGFKKEDLTLRDRIYNCNNCGLSIDRDLNAAINLKALATVSSTGSNASGDVGLLTSLKEELKHVV